MIDKTQKGYLILLFLISPFLGLMKLFKLKNEKDITFFGTLFFGLMGSIYIYEEGNDGHTHLMNVRANYLYMSFSEFFAKAYEVITLSSTEGFTDLYMHSLAFLSASVLRLPELIHVFAGLILGYFFTKSMLLVLKSNLRVKKSYILLFFIALFILIRSLAALNAIRMSTAMWVLFFGLYSFFLTKEKKYIFILLLVPNIHFSYLVILIPIAAAYVTQQRKKLLVVVYVISFFTSIGFSTFGTYIPEFDLIKSKQDTYAIDSEDKAEQFAESRLARKEKTVNANFYKAFGEINYLNYSIVGLSVILMFFYLKKTADPNLIFLVAIGIGLYAFSNFVSFSPSLQGRTKMIAAIFILAAAIHLQLSLKNYSLSQKIIRRLNFGLGVFLISSIPMVLFQISYIFQNFSFFTFIFPQLSWISGDDDYSIRAAIGLLID